MKVFVPVKVTLYNLIEMEVEAGNLEDAFKEIEEKVSEKSFCGDISSIQDLCKVMEEWMKEHAAREVNCPEVYFDLCDCDYAEDLARWQRRAAL